MNILQSHRGVNESFDNYRARRQAVAKMVGQLLKGKPAPVSKDGRRYVPGPHKTHKPHKVEFKGMTLSPVGVPTPHTWTVMHPGTLVKA